MFDLEEKIAKWKKSLRKNEALEEGYIAELESHLRDVIEEGKRNGKTDEGSFNYAVKTIGSANTLGEEYYKTDTTHLSKRPPWKENRFMPSLLPNYFKVASRNIFRHKGYSFINITGLAIGMACCILIALWVLDEMSFDTFHENAGNIYGIVQTQSIDNEKLYVTSTPAVFAKSFKEEFPEVIASTRYTPSWDEMIVSHKDKLFFEKSLAYADPSFLDIFSFPLLKGNKSSALSSPNSVIVDEEMAVKYFGDEDPIGKTIQIGNKNDFIVTGVMKKIPANSIFKFSALIPFETFLNDNKTPSERLSWEDNFTDTFIQLNKSASISDFNYKLKKYLNSKFNSNQAPEYTTLPLIESRFSAWYGGEKRITSITIFSLIAFMILLIACINFINLSIVSSAKRSLEIGLRKVVGATRRNIAFQFLGEFFVLSCLSFILAIVLVILFMPVFNELYNKNLKLDILFKGTTFLVSAGIIIFTGLIGGGYPALILSSFKPAVILNNASKSSRRSLLRRFFVVFQFTVSTAMIIIMSVIYLQYKFVRNQDPGFNKEQVIYLPLKSDTNQNYEVMKEQLTSVPGITGLTGATTLPSRINYSTSRNINWEEKNSDNNTLIYFSYIDFDFIKTLGMKLTDGKDITRELQTNAENTVLVNEEMVKLLNSRNPIGKELIVQNKTVKIIGIMKNFHFVSYDQNIPPLVLSLISNKTSFTMPNYQIISISPENFAVTLNLIQAKWKEINPLVPFEYHFLDEEFEIMYKSEEKLTSVIGGLTFMTILISALGLLGLASYTTEQRKKEIAIRKVLGSKITDVVGFLIKEYLYLVLTANIIAWPIGYFIAYKWLQDYAYKINIGAGIFILAGTSAFAIMAMAVGYQSIKAATANPIDSLKYE